MTQPGSNGRLPKSNRSSIWSSITELKVLKKCKCNGIAREDATCQPHSNVHVNTTPSGAEIHMQPPNWMKSIPFSLLFPPVSCNFACVRSNNRQGGAAAEPNRKKTNVLNLVQGAGVMVEAGFKGQSQPRTAKSNPRQQQGHLF